MKYLEIIESLRNSSIEIGKLIKTLQSAEKKTENLCFSIERGK